MKRPAPMDFVDAAAATTTTTISSSAAAAASATLAAIPGHQGMVLVNTPTPTVTHHTHTHTHDSTSSSPDLGQHSPARQRLRLDTLDDDHPQSFMLLNNLSLPLPATTTPSPTPPAADHEQPLSSFDPPTPLLASASMSSSSSILSTTAPNSFLALQPVPTSSSSSSASPPTATSNSRSPTPTLLSIQQALGNPPPSADLPPSTSPSLHVVDPDATPRLPSPATLRAANLRAQGLMVTPSASLPPTPTTPATTVSSGGSCASSPAALAPAPAPGVPTLPPAWAMPSGATIQQHLALQLQQAQQQYGAGTAAGSSSSSSSSDMGDQADARSSSSSGQVHGTSGGGDDGMNVDDSTTRTAGGAARGMAVNTSEPAFMTTLAQRHNQLHGHLGHVDDREDASFSSGSSSSEDDEEDEMCGQEKEVQDQALMAVVAAAADQGGHPYRAAAATTHPRQRTTSTRKRTTSSTSTTASKRQEDQPHGHLDPFSGTPVDLPHPDDDDWDHDTIDFMASVPPLSPMYQRRAPLLPPISSGKTHTLVLDLDETLLHCTTVPMADAGLAFSVDFNGVRFDIYGNLRPGVRRFLRKVAKVFEVVIFTASQQVYAERVLQVLDPRGEYISHVLHRDHCVPILGNYLKDLSVLGRDLRRTLIVDNAPQAFAYHPANGLPIRSWYDDPSDRALRRLGRRLVALAHLDDVRPAVRAMSHVHARLEGVARQSGRVPVGLAMAFSNHDADEIARQQQQQQQQQAGKAEDSMDVDSWGSGASSASSPATNASQEMMMMAGGFGFATPGLKQYSLSADAYPQLWQPAMLPSTVQVKLGLAPMPPSSVPSSASSLGLAHSSSPMSQQQQPLTDLMAPPIAAAVQQVDGSLAVVDRSVPMDEDVDLDHHDVDAEVVRVTSNYSPSPLLAPASLSTRASPSPFVGQASSPRASLNATPLAERRGNGSPEPLRLTPVQHTPGNKSTDALGAALAPESTLTTPATASNAPSSAVAASAFAVTPSSPANMNMAGMMMPVLPGKAASNETPLPTPVTPTFADEDMAASGRKQVSADDEDRMDVVTAHNTQQAQGQSVEEAGLMAAMAVSE